MASRANVYIDKGTDFRITIGLSDDDGGVLPVDSYDFFGAIRKMYSITKIADFIIEKDSVNSAITLVLTDTVTLPLKPGKYQYDVLMRKTSGEISKVVEGLAIIVPTISEVI
jgi:hypothetical protein